MMKQKLEQIRQEKVVFEKESTLMDVFTQFLEKKGKNLSNFDKYAKIVMFSVDGEIPNKVNPETGARTILSPAEMMDVVVKPNQDVRVLPRVAGG